MSFKRFKDRTWGAYSLFARTLAAAPGGLGQRGFAATGKLLWLAYVAPGSPLRLTMNAFAEVVGTGPPRLVFSRFVHGLMLGLYRMERLRLGHEAEIDALLDIPERGRLDAMLERGGAMLVMPHANGSLPMVCGLGRHYPLLMLVKTTRSPKRSASQHAYYERMGCEILDVRRTGEARVARTVVRALRDRRIVVVTGDLIQKAPSEDIDKARDLVRAEAFGQPLGAPGWPARFALRAGAPLLPVMIEQTDARIVLHLGRIAGDGDVAAVTRDWVAQMEGYLRRYPSDWTFVFDRRWSRLLGAAARERST